MYLWNGSKIIIGGVSMPTLKFMANNFYLQYFFFPQYFMSSMFFHFFIRAEFLFHISIMMKIVWIPCFIGSIYAGNFEYPASYLVRKKENISQNVYAFILSFPRHFSQFHSCCVMFSSISAKLSCPINLLP